MRVRQSFLGLALLAATLQFSACSNQTESAASSPQTLHQTNVLLITIDTLRADYLGSYGRKGISTPQIDSLAARGVRFARAFAQVPLTTPSHASILTGAYPPAHKIRDVGGFVLDTKVTTLAEVLGKAGYETAAFVAAAVLDRHYRLDRGFQVYNDEMGEDQPEEKLPGVVAEVRGDVVTKRALDWLRKREGNGAGSKPFLLWVHYYDPHFPYDPPEPYRQQFAKDPYAGEVAYTDSQVGRLLELLAQSGLQEKTLVVLLSDHGESLGEHGEETHGVFLYDSTMHVPLMVAGPAIRKGGIVEQQVQSVDVVPTILDYLGLAPSPSASGASLKPALAEGKRVRSPYAYMETLYPKTHMGWSELRALRTDDWKLVLAPRPELYRPLVDPTEKDNVLNRYPVEADRLQKKIWEIAGPPSSWKIETQPVDPETWQKLKSLGYVSAGTRRELHADTSGPDPKDRVEVLRALDRATELMNHDQFAAAIPVLQKSIQNDTTNPLLYQHLGMCFQELKQFKKALDVYQTALKNKAETDRTYAEIGEIYIRFGDLPEAIKAFEASSKINPSNTDNLNNLANAYLQLGRLKDAERAAQAVLAQHSKNAAAHNFMGLISLGKGQRAEARLYFEKAILGNPKLAEPYMNLGLLAQQSGDVQTALRYYKAFLERATGPQYRDVRPRVKAAIAELEGRP